MNVLYVHNVGNIGGAERVTLDMIRGLADEHRLFLVTPQNGPLLDQAEAAGAKSRLLDVHQPDRRHPFRTWKSDQTWLAYLKQHQIDLVHTGDLFITRSLLKAVNRLNIPLICHVHFPVDDPALRWIFRIPPKRCCFVYCSRELHDITSPKVDRYIPNAEHRVLHNGVDTTIYRKYHPVKGVLPTGKLNVGIIANLQERKGHVEFIEAAAAIAKQESDVQFHIIGGDLFGESREPYLRQLAAEAGLQNKLTFHGHVDNVKDFLNELDVFVCASHEEAFPISLLEAMAFGLPIVTTDVNGIPEAVIQNHSALLVPAKQAEPLAIAIGDVIADANLRYALGEQALSRVKQYFDLPVFIDQIQHIHSCCRGPS